ncbi:MAG: IMPACT family protein [Bifidobacteriaceae bacterium]|jgi:uncharacterized YigZ family protein|nr:IMPACT family protein [Bifidobacteriaceae bacterium]
MVHDVAYVFLSGPVSNEQVIKKSRFITQLFPLTDPEAARALIQAVRKEHYQARHHCSASIVGPAGEWQRSNDDGEPAGTAGAPMLEVLRRRQVSDILAVVTRYFGGTLLGAGGLVRAYAGGVTAALDQARLVRKVWRDIVHVEVPAAAAGRAEHDLRAFAERSPGVAVQAVSYSPAGATLEVALDPAARAGLEAWLAGAALPARLNDAGRALTTMDQ